MRKLFLYLNETIDRIVRSSWAPWVIFFVAVATRTVGALLGGDHSDDGDHSYRGMAYEFLAGRGLSLTNEFGRVYSYIPPGMGLLNIVFISLFGEQLWPVRIIFVLMSAAANVALFYIGKRLYEVKFAWLAALWWALYPPQWFWASRMNPQTYSTNGLIFCLLLLYLGWEKRRFWLALIIGVLWASVALTRAEYIFGIGVFILLSLFSFPSKREGTVFASLLLAGWILGLTPWVIRNYKIQHRILLVATNYGYNFWKAYNPAYDFSGYDIPVTPDLQSRLFKEPGEIERAELLKSEAMVFIRENPRRALRNVIGNLLHFWRPWLSPKAVSLGQNILYLVSYLPLFALFVIALFKIPWRDPKWVVLPGIILYKWMIHAPFYVVVRYREAIMPIIALVAMLVLRDYWLRALSKNADA